MPLKGKITIITGAARGIGYACAERFLNDGAKVILADIDEKGGEEAARELAGEDADAEFISCNVGDELDIRNLVAGTLHHHGRIDILINNAAMLDSAPFLELEVEELRKRSLSAVLVLLMM